ncbi:MAG TPA: two-component system sensor histidine kinase CreC, partial [Comamonadaceae bacterium]|nr:two-component system sensor histidine kinase CreC [Comamonadaceae bacterium]
MRLGIRLLFAFFVINGIAAFFVLRVFTAEIKPSVREVMEDMMVDTANLLAELASDDLTAGRLAQGGNADSAFARQVRNYASRPVDAGIWGFAKQSLDYRIYVTDAAGRVLFDSEGQAVGQDFSQWRDVARTLRGEYGARMTREVPSDDTSGVMHVAAPVRVQGRIIGVLTVAKPVHTVQRFIDRAERKILMGGLLLLALSAAVGVAVTLWMVWNVRRLRDYALSVQGPADGEHDTPPATALAVPQVPGELGDLARAMDRMRARLEGRDYIEGYVRALTHELKSPVAALRGAGELLQDDLPAADRARFATQVVQQSERLQRLIERLLELSKLEQRQHAEGHRPVALHDCARTAIAHTQARAAQRGVVLALAGHGASGPWEAELITLALTNLLDNAVDFAPEGSTVRVELDGPRVAVQDSGPGVPGYALPRLG